MGGTICGGQISGEENCILDKESGIGKRYGFFIEVLEGEVVVGPRGFEPRSPGPEPGMLGHYTTALLVLCLDGFVFHLMSLVFFFLKFILVLSRVLFIFI